MAKNKLRRFEENKKFSHLFQLTYEELEQGFPLKGKWRTDFFKNDNPIVLELACGKGEYTVGLAKLHPDVNYVGIDIKGARIWKGAKEAEVHNLNNVAFIRTRIHLLEHFFAADEIDEIWIVFPDPQPRSWQERRRLSNSRFMTMYIHLLKPGGLLHLKTDNTGFYDYTVAKAKEHNLKNLFHSNNVYAEGTDDDVVKIQTYYEKKFAEKGETIKYGRWKAEG